MPFSGMLEGTVRENFLILKKLLDWLAAIRKSEEYQWRWNVNLARGLSNKFSSDSAFNFYDSKLKTC
jgi:hypothetical protein